MAARRLPGALPRPTILLTGFEPFGGEPVNPAWLIAQALDGESVDSARIVALRLPCVFGEAADVLRKALRRHRPALVLALGQAAGRSELTPERVAINVDDARIPDNAGAAPIDRPVVPGGPAAYFSSLPVKRMVQALREAGLPAAVSQTAGTFVCNHVFYALMHALRRQSGVRGGFMHVPLMHDQAERFPGAPSLALAEMVSGVRVALEAAWRHGGAGADILEPGGAEH